MIIDTSDFLSLPGITQATLSESTDSPSVLNLSWAGFGPDWLRWMEPVTVIHRGKVLFHGRMNSFERTNAAGSLESSATVVNALWLMDNLPLGAQVAEAKAATATSAADFAAAGRNALMSWTALAESCRVAAPLWVVDEAGVPQEDGIITLDVSGANYSTGAVYKRDKIMTAWTALLEMKQANPDAVFRFNYTTGAVEVVAIGSAPVADWSTDDMLLTACSSIAPQYENCITGVALVVSWSGNDALGGGGGGSVLRVYPEGVEAGDMGVKLYQAQVEDSAQATAQADYMMRQLRQYYDAVNVLQHGGSVTALLEDVTASPLCTRLNITGTGTHDTWHSMAAVVSGVEWDFLAGTVEAQLGAQIDEPEISEMTFPDYEGDDGDSSDDFSGDEDFSDDDFTTDEEELTTYPDILTTWDFTTTWGEESTTWEYTTTWDDESTTWTASTGETETATSGSTPGSESGSQPGSETPPLPSWDDESTTWTGTGSATGSGGSVSFSTSGSQTSSESGSSGGGSESACDCAAKWEAYETRISALEARVAALEALHDGTGSGSDGSGSNGTSGCNCECAGLLDAIQQAVQQAAAGVSLTATVTQAVMTTDYGTISVTGDATAAGGTGSSSVSFSY